MTTVEIPREHSRRSDGNRWPYERNVQWRAGEWTISYLWRHDYLAEVWIWETNGGHKRAHALTPQPVGVRDAVDAYELVARALLNPALAPPRWEEYPSIADRHECINCGYSFDEHDPFDKACPDDDEHAARNAEEW